MEKIQEMFNKEVEELKAKKFLLSVNKSSISRKLWREKPNPVLF